MLDKHIEHKSARTSHAHIHDCDWERVKVVYRERNRCTHRIKEAIWIRKTAPTMDRDEGGYRLGHVWDSLLAAPSSEQSQFSS